jgi:hypothetical protein
MFVHGNECINFAQDISELATILPIMGPDVPVVTSRLKRHEGR